MSQWRSSFPFFLADSPVKAFLDSAASAQKPACVLQAMDDFSRTHYANIHRGVHHLAQASTLAYEGARSAIARFIGAPTAESVIITHGTTHAVNMMASSWGQSLQKGDVIIVSTYEHHSNFLPWQRLAAQTGAVLKVVPLTPSGDIDLEVLRAYLKVGARLVAVAHASNVLGAVTPLKEVIEMAHAHRALVFVDGAQAVAHMPVNVKELGADFYCFSGHKLYGPTGVGALYIASQHSDSLPPYEVGGGMVHRVGEKESSWAPVPYRFEAGTPPIVEAIGLHMATEFVSKIGFPAITAHEQQLTAYLLKRLATVPGIHIYGAPHHRIGVVSFNLGDIHPHDVGTILDEYGVAVRVGHHCAQPLMAHLGVTGTVRASLGLYNNESDVDLLVTALEAAHKKLS